MFLRNCMFLRMFLSLFLSNVGKKTIDIICIYNLKNVETCITHSTIVYFATIYTVIYTVYFSLK